MVPMAIAWKWIYDYNYGLLNYGLSLVGIAAVAWLTDPEIALWALIIMGVWKVLGYNLILFLVGIRNIPATLSSRPPASTAPSAWQRFCHVTLPLLKPILLYVLVTATINAFNVFTQVYVMTLGSQAAPGQAVRVLVFDIYQNGFQYFHMGYASAEAVDADLHRAGLHADPVPPGARAQPGGVMRCGSKPHRARIGSPAAAADPRRADAGRAVHGPADAVDAGDLVQAGARDRDLAAATAAAGADLANYTGIFEVGAVRPLLPQQRRHLAGRDARACSSPRWSPAPSSPNTASPAARLLFGADHRHRDRAVRELHDPALSPAHRDRLDQHLPGHRPALPVHELRHLPDAPARLLGDPDRAISRRRGSTAPRSGGSCAA